MEEKDFEEVIKHIQQESVRKVLNYLHEEIQILRNDFNELDHCTEEFYSEFHTLKDNIRPEQNPVGGEALSATRTEEESE
jgi:hypothetical protein